jgi:hypothetical protein
VVALEVRSCGRWFLVAFCAACGGNTMIDNSRTKKEPLRSSFPFLSLFVLLDGCVPRTFSD